MDGLILHLLGMTTLTLVVGWSLSIVAASLSLLVMNLLLGLDLGGYPVSWFFTVLLPASVSSTLASLLCRPRLKNPFFYMLGTGFAVGGLVVMLIALLAEALFALTGLGGLLEAISEYWPLLLLMMFSEAFINGMCVSALAIFFPDWLKTFDDHFYLDDAYSASDASAPAYNTWSGMFLLLTLISLRGNDYDNCWKIHCCSRPVRRFFWCHCRLCCASRRWRTDG